MSNTGSPPRTPEESNHTHTEQQQSRVEFCSCFVASPFCAHVIRADHNDHNTQSESVVIVTKGGGEIVEEEHVRQSIQGGSQMK